MSYGTGQQKRTEYSISPTVQDIDADLADMTEAQLERHHSYFDPTEIGTKRWEATSVEQRLAVRAGNELARRKHAAERKAVKAADDARIEAQHNAANQVKIDAYRQQVRAGWVGDSASFDVAFPEMLRQWQIDQARAKMDATLNYHRARMNSAF